MSTRNPFNYNPEIDALTSTYFHFLASGEQNPVFNFKAPSDYNPFTRTQESISITRKQLREAIGASKKEINSSLKSLIKKGLIEQKEDGTYTLHWKALLPFFK